MKKLLKRLALAALLMLAPTASMQAGDFTVGDKTFLLNGEPFIVKAAEVHYPRIPRPYWEHRIRMCKALGMNAVCIYIFWNIHEQREGQFDFTGQNDVAEFCRLAQKNGLYVIVRPGPYVCAEWEMGGLPWWLLKKKDIRLRERDPYFMERVKIFEQKVGEQLAPLTIQNGGPIIMIQVENEYGSYGEDKPYVSEIRDCLRKIYEAPPSAPEGATIDPSLDSKTIEAPSGAVGGAGSVLLFQCDWSSNFEKNGLDDLTWTMNFGTGANIDQQFRRLGELRPNAPKMCSEFWSGWFDKWGARHETRPAKDMVEGMDEMLSKGISFSLYMTHGGTSFGHWAGANSPGFAPDVTSYDYDAPINEYGQATPKYWELRKMMEKYNDGKKMPAVPKAPMPIITVPRFELKEFAPLMYANGGLNTDGNQDDLSFEAHNLGWGYAAYYTTLPELPHSSVLTADFHDFAQVFIDGKYIGKIDRVKNEKSLTIPPAKAGSALVIVVEAMGRINFGRAIKDFKGIIGNVTISSKAGKHDVTYSLNDWEIYFVNDEYETALTALNRASATENNEYIEIFKDDAKMMGGRGYYRGYFNLKKVGDTFLNFETWGKGQVYVNGHAMGRIWSIGPQQTLYVPGCWLKKGKNEIIVLDIVGPKQPVVWGQAEPELNKLQLEKSNKHNNIGDKPDLNSATPVSVSGGSAAGSAVANPGNGWQTFRFAAPQKGRYLAIEVLSTQKDGDRAAIAELYLQGPDGRRLSREPWTCKYANSEEENGNHTGDKVFDLQESTYWQTERSAQAPHLLVIDLGSVQTVSALEYLPRAEQGAPGSIKDFRIYLY
ncbi:MAG: beta-galactosidase [Prevotella sp.]|nr:beta-galactosidase [Prevotella sp.]MBQ9646536.1 beta-galactosidase [Prevotella sp.]